MAVFQAEIVASIGYYLNTSLTLKSNSFTALGNFTDTLLTAIGSLESVFSNYQYGTILSNAFIALSMGSYQPYQSRFARFFGEGSRQTSTHIYIKKAALPLLNPTLTNSSQSLMVALLLKVMADESNSLISRVTVEVFNIEFLANGNLGIMQTILIVNLYSFVQKFEQFEILLTSVTPNSFN